MSESGFSDHEIIADDRDDHVNVLDLLQVVAENVRLLVVGPLLAGLVALAISFTLTPRFSAVTTFLPPQQQQSVATVLLQSLGPLAGAVGAGVGAPSAERYIAFIESRSVRDALIERFDLMSRENTTSREAARAALAADTTVAIGKKGVMSLEVEHEDPKLAADLANAYVEELTRFIGRLDVTEARARRMFFEGELKKTKDGLLAAEAELRSTGISESAVKASPAAAVGSVATLMAHIAAKEVEVSAMRGYLTEGAPDFKRAQNELRALRAQLSQFEKDSTDGRGSSDYVSKYRNYKYYETLFELVAKQYEAARIDESREGSVIQVIDRAVPPEQKSKPKKAQIAVLTALATGFALLLFVFARNAFRNAGRDPEVAQKMAGLRSALRRGIRKS